MNLLKRACALCATAIFVLVPATATAKPKQISGRLSERGYTVIALAASGEAQTDRAPQGKFKLRPPANKFTLHLRAPGGTYAGPVVIAKADHGKRAIVGIEAGAKLGKVEVDDQAGYAQVAHKLPAGAVDEQRQAKAKNGVPIGAGSFGKVRSKPPKDPARGDLDLDGIPDALDIDDDGDLILDDYDRHSITVKAAKAGKCCPGETFDDGSHMWVGTSMQAKSTQAVNVSGGSTDAQIAATQQAVGALGVSYIGIDQGSGELDCGALIYCSRGGTGREATGGNVSLPRDQSEPYPECCDPDHDGLGWLKGNGETEGIWHGATADQIRAGDVLLMRATINDVASQFATSVGFVFSTFPVIASYDDGQGNSGTFSYPLPAGLPPFFGETRAPVRAGPNGDVVLRLSVWRPQRRRIAGEPGDSEWMDVGNLTYKASVIAGQDLSHGGLCPQSSFSTADPNLTPVFSSLSPMRAGGFKDAGGFTDHSADQPQNAANTLTYTLNLTQCLASLGGSIGATDTLEVGTWAFATGRESGPPLFATTSIGFVRQP